MVFLLNDSNQFYDVELRREVVLPKAAEIEGGRQNLVKSNQQSEFPFF